ncbi:hypothetical protein M422DRAFT_85854, partial [Sphaerobolus stellatus SS14]
KIAHLIIKVSGAEVANQILQDGMVICNKHIRVCKMAREPRHCLKCQKINVNYISNNCPSAKDVFSSCDGKHRTKDFLETDPNKFKYTNGNTYGHASWGRDCPTY